MVYPDVFRASVALRLRECLKTNSGVRMDFRDMPGWDAKREDVEWQAIERLHQHPGHASASAFWADWVNDSKVPVTAAAHEIRGANTAAARRCRQQVVLASVSIANPDC